MSAIKAVGVVIKPHASSPGRPGRRSRLSSKAAASATSSRTAAAERLAGPAASRARTSPEPPDLVVVLGGDGTLLSIAHVAAPGRPRDGGEPGQPRLPDRGAASRK